MNNGELSPGEVRLFMADILARVDALAGAVLALKPVPDDKFRCAVCGAPSCSCTHEAGDSDCAVHPTCNVCGADLEHLRAPKPAPVESSAAYIQYFKENEVIERLRKELECVREQWGVRGENMRRAQDEIERLNKLVRDQLAELDRGYAEAERLQKVVADQALTIGALQDELGKIRDENETRRIGLAMVSKYVGNQDAKTMHYAAARVVAERDAAVVELKRFREREEKVTALVSLAIKLRLPNDSDSDELYDAAVVVRDFGVTP